MKKIKLSTSFLKLKKEEIGNLTPSEMRQVIGGYDDDGTGPCTTGTCPTDTCETTPWTCVQSKTCPPPPPPPPSPPESGMIGCLGTLNPAVCPSLILC
jgi:hypothetical protein